MKGREAEGRGQTGPSGQEEELLAPRFTFIELLDWLNGFKLDKDHAINTLRRMAATRLRCGAGLGGCGGSRSMDPQKLLY
jgi:hypothetical protein